MGESAIHEEPRVAEAVARLLSRQATLLARSLDDEAAAGAARLGLSWLADLLRSFGLSGASDWFQALRVRADVLGDRTSAAWAALAAPLCEVLAAELRSAGSLAPLADGAHDWPARVAELTAFAEPPPRVAAPPSPPIAQPAAPPAAPLAAPPAPAPPAPAAPSHDEARMALFEAIADLAGDAMPEVDARHGRIEISGERPGRGGNARPPALRALDQAARAAGAMLVATEGVDGLRWLVRLPLSSEAHYLFIERGGEGLAVPWSRVVEYGLAPRSTHARVVLGQGLERTELTVDWLVGQGAGTPLPDEPAPASGSAAPDGFVFLGRVADAEGRPARVLDLAPAPLPGPAPPPAAEAIQPVAVPADNLPESPPPARTGLRALVADDSMMARVFLSRLLAQRGFAVDEAEDGAQAQAALRGVRYDIAFLDAEMPGAGAIEILNDAGALLAGRACVLVKDEDERRMVESLGHVPVLFKPFAEDEVRGAVDALLTGLPRTD